MRLVRSTAAAGLADQGCVLTIGNFDAVHRGHRKILANLRSHGMRLGLPTVVMTFDPHPEEYFLGEKSSSRLSNLSSRFFALKECGVDMMLCLRFDEHLASTGAEKFVQKILQEELSVRYLLVGDDFRFGRDRCGDYDMLLRMGPVSGFDLDRTGTFVSEGERISSTRIRRLLESGDLDAAATLLGQPYTLVGRIVHGQQLGRTWGFPTLNLPIHHKPALTGVFAVRVQGLAEHSLHGVANLGTRPTVGGLRTLLEVHLFDFDQAVYGKRVCVEFVKRIRPEEKFSDLESLQAQIRKDCVHARQVLGGG